MWTFILEYKKILGFLLMPIIAAASLFGYQYVPASSKTEGPEIVNEQMRVLLEHPAEKNMPLGQSVDSDIVKGDKAQGGAASAKSDPIVENTVVSTDPTPASNNLKIEQTPTPKSSTAPSAQPKSTSGKTAKAAKTNLNTASLDKLIDLPNIGETKAKEIIAYREKNKVFNTIEEIMNVKGIGPKTFESLKDFITVSTHP